MPPAETVEYIHTNLNDAQKAWCAKYEADGDNNQVRVERFNNDGSAIVHLYGERDEPRIVTLTSDGKGLREDERHDEYMG